MVDIIYADMRYSVDIVSQIILLWKVAANHYSAYWEMGRCKLSL